MIASALVPMFAPDDATLVKTGAMVFAGMLELLVDTAASSVFISNAQHIPMSRLWGGQIKNRLSLHAAFLSVAALMALAYEPLGPVTFVLFLLPLLAARYAFKRYASIHTLYSQTVRALAKVSELAGYTPDGHSLAVAKLATSVAREFGMSDNEVQDVEFAALLHDVGKLSMDDPVKSVDTSSQSGKAVADSSAALIDKTPYLARVAKIIRGSEGGYAPGEKDTVVMLGARILKAANGFVELQELPDEEGSVPAQDPIGGMRQDAGFDAEVLSVLDRVIRARLTPTP